MKNLFFLLITFLFMSCLKDKNEFRDEASNKDLSKIFENYFEEYLQMFPLEATMQGDKRYNDRLPNDLTQAFKKQQKDFYQKYLSAISEIDPKSLNANDRIAYDTFMYRLKSGIEGLAFPTELIPFQQFDGLTLQMGQLGSGDGAQPFDDVKDYDNWLKRVSAFKVWADTAIVNFRNGMAQGYVLPKALVTKMIPQMDALVVTDPTKSLFYGPVLKLPKRFSDAERTRITEAYKKAIMEDIVPTYQKLGTFLRTEYIHKAKVSSGTEDIPQGKAYYQFLVKEWTTTQKTPDEIYEIGLKEVARIRTEMENVKKSVGFEGDLVAFFNHLKNSPQFTPYKKPEEVIAAFEGIHERVKPNLAKMFTKTPKTAFEIRRTEAFREASASAEYNQGTPDGKRPGIFYVPIPNVLEFNTTSGMESLFLHEAIPGHHYQVSLQQENQQLPKFMRFSWYGAYGEGWALYTESLGKELGLYADPYQYMGALGDEIHRAIRLVVDVGLHTKNWTREKAIQYMLENEAASEQYATMEIERYMAIPGQALSYKIGALKIQELRKKYERQLGPQFSLAAFHDELLKDGCLPLDVLEAKMDRWATSQTKK